MDKIYEYLIYEHYDYYCTVYRDFIYEAIKNTLEDFKNKKDYTMEDIHKNIIKNYI